jgi:hypothetical protein
MVVVGMCGFAALSACDQKPAAGSSGAGGGASAGAAEGASGGPASASGQFLPQGTTPQGDVEQAYTTRGVIMALPGPNRAKQFLQIHHEEIPEFVGRSGSVVGMKEMIMDFPDVASGEVVRGFAVGDAVRFTFEVRWKGTPRTLVTSIERLPEGEELELSKVVEGE